MKNVSFYQGILFYFLYLHLYYIVSNLIAGLLLSQQSNIYLLAVLLPLLAIGLLFLFYYLKKNITIRWWMLLVILFLHLAITFLSVPGRYYIGMDSIYSIDDRAVIRNTIYLCQSAFLLGIVTISYIKYTLLRKASNATATASNSKNPD